MNKIFSDNSQLQYAYFDLPFVCPPSGKKHGSSPFASGHSISLNLGEVLRGDRIKISDFEVAMGKDVPCQFLCERKIGRKEVRRAKQLISDGYVVEWIMDNLPGATTFLSVDRSRRYYSTGFKLGYQDFSPVSRRPMFFIHNHFTFVIRWRDAPGKAGANGGKVIVGFEIYPKSIGNVERSSSGCPKEVHVPHEQLELRIAPNTTMLAEKYPGSSYLPDNENDGDDDGSIAIPYTYSVYFRKEDSIGWRNRWDLYFKSHQERKLTHWFAIFNALTVATVLGFIVFVIWGRAAADGKGRGEGYMEEGKLRLNSRNSRSGTRTPRTPRLDEKQLSPVEHRIDDDLDDHFSDDESEEVASWKRLHGDVFRTPAYSGLLAPLVGSGVQLLFMATGLLTLSCLGVLNPSFRGGFVSVGMGLFVFAGAFSGYFSGRLYKTFGGKNWRKNTSIVSLRNPQRNSSWLNNADFVSDRFTVSRIDVHFGIHPQSICMGASFQHSPPVWHSRGTSCPVAFDSSAIGLHWQLVWLRKGQPVGASHPHQCNSTTNTGAIVVFENHSRHPFSRTSPVHCSLRRVPLRPPKLDAGQDRILLPFWLYGHYLLPVDRNSYRGDHHRYLRSALCRESPMVVAELYYRRQQRNLDLLRMRLVLLYEATCARVCFEFTIFRIQFSWLCRLWSFDRNSGFSHGLCVCSPNI